MGYLAAGISAPPCLALALTRPWQYAVLVGSLNLLQARLRGVVLTLLAAGAWMCSSAQPG
jgi:hypothetical protein